MILVVVNVCDSAGIEYIISDRIFETLPAEEQKLWHSHEYEVIDFHFVHDILTYSKTMKLTN